MKELIYIVFGWVLTATSSWCTGKLLLRRLSLGLYREEENVLAFVVGSACVSAVVFFLGVLHLVYRGVFLALGVLPIAIAIRRRLWKAHGDRLPDLPAVWKLLFLELYLPFAAIYIIYALAPEASPDGSTYHLGLVARYAREHVLPAITTNMYASLSQGMEMLFLFAFLFGRHSAAALVHCTCLLMLPLVILNYARRIGVPSAGVVGGLLIFLAPVAGISGTSAYNDVAVTLVSFSLFALLQIWSSQRATAALIPVGLLAGFAFDIKYTAFIAIPYALAFVTYKCWSSHEPVLRPVLVVTAAAAMLVLPTLVKNSIVVHNPISPFFNRLFPNPYVHVDFEDQYRQQQRTYRAIQSIGEIPLELTVHGGKLQGLLGPVFLLAPVALLALRYAPGRQLLLAALVFLLPYPFNIGARFILPCAAFIALALALVVSSWHLMAVLLILCHAWLCWPSNVGSYCDPNAFRLDQVPVRAALRLESEDEYLAQHLARYVFARRMEMQTPPGSRIFAFDNPPEAYCAREILVSFQAALNERFRYVLYAGFDPDLQPLNALTYHIRPVRLRRLRVVQTASGRPGMPGISQIEIFGPQGQLQRTPSWRFHARPFPWDAPLAFDRNPATYWRAWQQMEPGMFVEIDFGEEQVVTLVRLDVTPDQGNMRWHLEGEVSPGQWSLLSADPDFSTKGKTDLRRAAIQELRQSGISYIVVPDSEFAAPDFRENTALWGIRLVFETERTRLYQIE